MIKARALIRIMIMELLVIMIIRYYHDDFKNNNKINKNGNNKYLKNGNNNKTIMIDRILRIRMMILIIMRLETISLFIFKRIIIMILAVYLI